MTYWIKRIVLATGEIVTERELRPEENQHGGPPPIVGDIVDVECRGRRFRAKVIWGNWPGLIHPEEVVIPLRVAEVGLDVRRTRLWRIRHSPGKADERIDLAPLYVSPKRRERIGVALVIGGLVIPPTATALNLSHYWLLVGLLIFLGGCGISWPARKRLRH